MSCQQFPSSYQSMVFKKLLLALSDSNSKLTILQFNLKYRFSKVVGDNILNDLSMLTLREAAFVFGETFKDIARVIDEHPELTPKVAYGKRALRVLGKADLMYLQALREVGELLTPIGRRVLHEALINSHSAQEITVGEFVLHLDQLQCKVERRLQALNRLKDGVEGHPENPYIKGTDVEVYRISALLDGGATVEQVAEDYPLLTREQIKAAHEYAAAIPKKGRPYPKKSFKRATRTLNLDVLDELLAEERTEEGGPA